MTMITAADSVNFMIKRILKFLQRTELSLQLKVGIMQEILGPGNSFNEMQKYIDFYKEKSKEGKFTPEELFNMEKEFEN